MKDSAYASVTNEQVVREVEVMNTGRLDQKWNDWLIFVLLIAPAFAISLPIKGLSMLLIPALVAVYLCRSELQVDRELKLIALLFVGYILVFTFLSQDLSRSAKGAYDMLRALLMFPVALLLGRMLEDPRRHLLFTMTAALLIAGHFFFPQSHFQTYFHGYHQNPNNVAVNLVVYLLLAFPTLTAGRLRWPEVLSGAAALVMALVLLGQANSRGAWAGVFAGSVACTLAWHRVSLRYRLCAMVALVAGLVAIMQFANVKGVDLRHRDQIWLGLYEVTLEERPWFGYGINYVKDLMREQGLPHLTAHNLFLEIFVSSGMVGLMIIAYIVYRLVCHLLRYHYRQSSRFFMGLFGTFAFLTMGQFDLKLSGFDFLASICLFLGLLYSQRIHLNHLLHSAGPANPPGLNST